MASAVEVALGVGVGVGEISDSSDFPATATAPGLRALDDALRCDICRDFYDAPVSLPCAHSFCSLCIRSALPISATCPTCTKQASEVHLRKNMAIESAVHAWKLARPLILGLVNEEHERKTRPAHPEPRNPHRAEPSRKRKRSGSPSNPTDDEIMVLSSPSPAPSESAAHDDPLPDTVTCPLCQHTVFSQNINMHIDSDCKRHLAEHAPGASSLGPKGKQRQQWSMLLGNNGPAAPPISRGKKRAKAKGKARAKEADEAGEPAHLPKVAYDIHPQKRIAELLHEWGLPTHGDRHALVRRHSRWIVYYNANVDRAPQVRKTLEQLRSDLRRAEEAEQRTRKETVDDPVAYQKANKAAFAKLTEAARPKKNEKSAQPDPPPPERPAASPTAATDVVEHDICIT